MKRLVKHLGLAALLATGAGALSAEAAELTPTTIFFTVDDYYVLDGAGNHRVYQASGFFEPGKAQVQPRLFLLPQISVDHGGVQFFNAEGESVTLGYTNPPSSIKRITIPLRYSGSLPTEQQSIGIAVQTGGTPQPAYLPPPLLNGSGQPLIHPWAQVNPAYVQEITRWTNDYKALRKPQDDNLARWRSYKAESIALNELSLAVVVDDEVVAQRQFPNALIPTGSSLPSLTLKDPDARTVRRVRDGNFEVLVSYRFRDARVGTIDASFDVASVIDSYVKETQTAVTSNKSSGFQLFHIGRRRNKIKQSLDRSLTNTASEQRAANTVIVMNDADDSQVQRFDSTFFPSLSQQQVIEGHLKAADEAKAAGNADLAKVHLDYANALQAGSQLAEVDAVGAAAALNEGDYATFLAKGVRFMSDSNNMTGTFSRVATERISSTQAREWTDVSKRSVQRALTLVVRPEKPAEVRPYLGLCGAIVGPFPTTLMLTCLQEGGPLARAGFVPGEVIRQIDGHAVATAMELDELSEQLKPGERVDVTLVAPNGSSYTRQVRVGTGPRR